MATITELEWKSLTAAVNNIKSPNQFLKRSIFSTRRTFPTRAVETGELTGARAIAPFVTRGAEAQMVGGTAYNLREVSTPHIRIKRPFTPSPLLMGRKPGTPIFNPGAAQSSAVRAHIARDLQYMGNLITNSEELLCALALQGAVSYSNSPQDHFQVTYPRDAGNTIVLTTFWDDPDPDQVEIEENVISAKAQVNEQLGLALTDAILSPEAGAAFRRVLAKKQLVLDTRRLTTGSLDLTRQFSEDGVLYLGNLFGIDWWQYGRTIPVAGVSTRLIRQKYCEFIANVPSAEFSIYYGAIEDLQAFDSGLLQAERYSKSWEVEDPSAIMALIESNPLPVLRQADACLSMQVLQ